MSDKKGIVLIVLLCILGIFVPPAPVLILRKCSWSFLLSIILWILFWIPGVIYAFYVIINDMVNGGGSNKQIIEAI